jgi:hypothetical protein
MSTYGNQQPPNPGPGQYGSPQPPPGGTTYGGNTYGSPSSGAPYGGGTYGSAPTSGGTYGAPPAGAPQYGGAPYGSAPGGAPYGGGPAGGPPPYGSQPPQQGTNGLSIAGLVLAFLIAPVGFILSVIGLVQAGKRGQKGKGLAIAGIIISLLLMIGSGVLVAAAASKVTKLADPGCTIGKSAVLDNTDKISNPDTLKEGLQATITGLDKAIAQASHSDVRDAMKALRDDYNQMLNAVTTGTPPDSNLTNKITTDGNRVDSLCSIGTK